MGADAGALQGLRVLVTRPAGQADDLAARIAAAGGEALRFPLLEIAAPPDAAPLQRFLARLEHYDLAIFISANAVEWACRAQAAHGAWPPGLRLAAVGSKTAACMAHHGLTPDLVPDRGYNSEALLALPELQQVRGTEIVIFRGAGGRELLAEQLRARGARVDYAEVYRRVRPRTTLDAVVAQAPDIIMVTSSEALENLYALAGSRYRDWVVAQPLLLISARIARRARALGFHGDLVSAAQASDEGMLAALVSWASRRHGDRQ